MPKTSASIIPVETIERKILLLRGKKVMLDADLADLYGVKTKSLIQAVKRNLDRFPGDFMFQLTKKEFSDLRSQIVTSSLWGGRRYLPYLFTEQGVAMLSSVLNSKRAVQTNIAIMRAFVHLRELLATHADLDRKIKAMEENFDSHIRRIYQVIAQLRNSKESKKARIGFRPGGKQ